MIVSPDFLPSNEGAKQEDRLILVRAAINLPGLKVGNEVLVNPDVPVIAEYLRVDYLVPVVLTPATVNWLPQGVTEAYSASQDQLEED